MLGAGNSTEPTGEAWLLSDVPGSETVVADGPLAGKSLGELIKLFPNHLLGRSVLVNDRFPLLLKFIDARQDLSVQVHPNDLQVSLLEPGSLSSGKTEAWVILQSEPASLIYAGLNPGVTRESFEQALRTGKVLGTLHRFHPTPGECVFLQAGTIHAIGAGLMLFEIQQTSDITYRLFDWNRVDAKTGKPRALHVDKSLECTDFAAGPCRPIEPVVVEGHPGQCELLADCPYFQLYRHWGTVPFPVGTPDECRAIVVIEGTGSLESLGQSHSLKVGDTFLLSAETGRCRCVPKESLTVLECCLPRHEIS